MYLAMVLGWVCPARNISPGRLALVWPRSVSLECRKSLGVIRLLRLESMPAATAAFRSRAR